jgi:carbon monoxide dehydrogenase subunit G
MGAIVVNWACGPGPVTSRTASSMMETTGGLTFAAEGGGTVMSWDWQVRPRGWMRMLGPLAGALGGRMERRIWTGLKHQLEDAGSARSA